MRSSARALAPLAVAVVAAALVGCSTAPTPTPQPSIPPGITAPPPTAPAEPPAPEVESSLPPEIAGVDTSAWQQVPVADVATFRIPPEWSTEEISGGLAVLRADGERQLALTIGAAGETLASLPTGCVDAAGTPVGWRTLGLDRQDVTITGATGVAFGAAALQLGEQWIVSMGLRPAAEAQSPRCPIINAFDSEQGLVSFGSETIVTGSGEGAPWAVGSLADAQAYVGSEEFATIRAILMSLELLP